MEKRIKKKKIDGKWVYFLDVGDLTSEQVDKCVSIIKNKMNKMKELIDPDIKGIILSLIKK
jgi:hypothetical protein